MYITDGVRYNADAVGAFNILRKYLSVFGKQKELSVTGLKKPEIIKVAAQPEGKQYWCHGRTLKKAVSRQISDALATQLPSSSRIREDATEAATKATTLKFVISMYKKGYTTAQIADVAGVDEKQIQDIIKNAKLLPV